MKVEIYETERHYNRATKKAVYKQIHSGTYVLSNPEEMALCRCAKKYNYSPAQMLGLIIAFYFGDGRNHLDCEFCDMWRDGCRVPAGGQLTLPILDKGSVVVGLPTSDLGK